MTPPSEDAVLRRAQAWRDYFLSTGALLPADAERFVAIESARYRAMDRQDFGSNRKNNMPPARAWKRGRTGAGRAIQAARRRREQEAAAEASDKALVERFLATIPPRPEPKPVVEPVTVQAEPKPDPVVREPTAAELERERGEQLRLAQIAKDMAIDVELMWQQMQRDNTKRE